VALVAATAAGIPVDMGHDEPAVIPPQHCACAIEAAKRLIEVKLRTRVIFDFIFLNN